MNDIANSLQQISSLPNCTLLPPSGQPYLEEYRLPPDLERFYEQCGGVVLFEGNDYSCTIVPPNQFVPSNPVIIGEQVEGDVTTDWFIIAHDGNGDYLSIDLNPERLGKCYDSFWDRHGVVGECPVIANSFTDLLGRLIVGKGESIYWHEDAFQSLGDAYDE